MGLPHNRRALLAILSLTGALIGSWHFLPKGFRELIQPTVHAASFTVNTADDHDDGNCNVADCSLREAINAANADSVLDTISFNISGGGVRTINLTSGLPSITKPVLIDGTTQTGFSGTPLIELNGTGAGSAVGLNFQGNSSGSTVKAIIINRFGQNGINMDTGTITVQGCFIGTNAAGTAAQANALSGIRINGSVNVIGGTTAAARNIISGNSGAGIEIVSGGSTVQGNFIGTDVNGTSAIPNDNGVTLTGVSGNTIGGTTAAARNLISGNTDNGVLISTGATNNLVEGNYIGTDVTGNSRLGNTGNEVGGVNITNSNNNTVGGTAVGAGNLLSGNVGANAYGIQVNASNGTVIQGNIIGLNAAGTAKIQNDAGGILLFGGSTTTVGGTAAGARNVVSGNGGGGILILQDFCQVQGNYFGTDANGTAAVGNGSEGVLLNGGDNNTIGGTSAAARNIISGNGNGGVIIAFSADGNTVQGNYIGTDVSGATGLGNGLNFPGVFIEGTCINNLIGGTVAGAGNIIAFNQAPGVSVVTNSTRDAILGNSIFSNSALGIDLEGDDVTANDNCDGDTGANNRQNYPVITSVTTGATTTTINGTLNSVAAADYRLEFFSNVACDSTGSGEGQTFLGATTVHTDPSCNVNFTFMAPNAAMSGPYITVTATDPNNNTSEFSACGIDQAIAPKTFQFSSSNFPVGEGDGHVTITVTRNGDPSGAASVNYNTTDTDNFTVNCATNQGKAFGRCDFATVVGTLAWAAGDATPKTFNVPIIDDSYAEVIETFGLVLTNPVGGTLGAPSTAKVSISDNETVDGPNPTLRTDSAGVDFFVRQHYLDFLGREPEPGQPWSAILNPCPDQFNINPNSPSAGCDRIQVSGSFFGSPEFKDKGIYVIDFYRVAFNRLPTYTEFVFDLASITGATAQEVFAKRAAYANNFVLRNEFTNSYGAMTNTQYVNALMSHNGQYNLTSITTRDPANPDTGNPMTLTINDLINGLNGATLTRAQVLRAIAQSDQVTQNLESKNAFVASQYYGYLRRTPDQAGFDSWINYLTLNPNDFRTMVHGFVDSPEYRLRFGPTP